ncbi:uncharacterized protein LOC105167851 isoform X2 [Sesamum indicum]|uniref:Uncharacterized protein LOC105167851 isoform X2 n=1 Tax=Sesamum indicum TaxID=4182 RepID=A0A6I9TJK4_SESIN|nr:uncharacterized protein LOC105167851 isoform X2 [Sesamum indicum]
MMEERQLDIGAPLLSMRRFSSPSYSSELLNSQVTGKLRSSRQQSPPLNKSDWEYVKVTEQASVPFQWEQIPGRTKSEVQIQVHTLEESSNTPRLQSPGRVAVPSRYNSGERSNNQNIYRPQIEAFLFGDHATLLEKLHQSLNCKDESGTLSDGDAYSIALQTESWSLNYSVSGLSGYQSSGVKPSGTFSIDRQTRDFMMDRFLTAAKAVVLELPKHVVKKPNEQPKAVKKMVSDERNRLLGHSGSYPLQYYIQYTDNVESEDGEHKYTFPVKKSGKSRLIIPLFCAKDSLCILSTSPGMKSKFHAPTSSAADARKLTRNAQSRPSDKNKAAVLHKRKSNSGLMSRDLPEIKNKLTGASKNQLCERGSGPTPTGDAVEKTVYIDCPSKTNQDTSCPNTLEEGRKLRPKSESTDKVRPSNCTSKSVYVAKEMGDIKLNRRLYQESRPLEFTAKVPSDTKSGIKDGNNLASYDQKDTDPAPLKPPLPPPLPKSPSESWLWRTAPSIYSGYPFSKSQNGIRKKRDQKGYITDTKWESIVKTSNLRHDDVLHSEGASPCLLNYEQ